jgi:hypothetical protein
MDMHAERDIVAIIYACFTMESAYYTLAFEFIEAFSNRYFRDTELRSKIRDSAVPRFEYRVPHRINDFSIAELPPGAGFVLSLSIAHASNKAAASSRA